MSELWPLLEDATAFILEAWMKDAPTRYHLFLMLVYC